MNRGSDSDLRALLREYIHLFAEKRYKQCHDRLEKVWRESEGGERDFLQALILLATTFYLAAIGRREAIPNYILKTRKALSKVKSVPLEIDLKSLEDDYLRVTRAIVEGRETNVEEAVEVLRLAVLN